MSLFLTGSGSEASQAAFKDFTRILRGLGRRRVARPPRWRREHAEMAGDRVKCGLPVVKLDPRMLGVGTGDELGDGRQIRVGHFIERLDVEPVGAPLDDVAQISERDTAVFLEDA